MPHTPQRHSCVVQPAMGSVFGDRPGHRPDGYARECHVECCIEDEHIPREKEESNGRIRHDTDPVVRWVRGDELDESTQPSSNVPIDGRQAECASAIGSHWTDLNPDRLRARWRPQRLLSAVAVARDRSIQGRPAEPWKTRSMGAFAYVI